MCNKKGKFARGALLGALVGAVAGVLFAPKSGKETRDDIKKKGLEAKDVASDKFEGISEAVVDTAASVKEVAVEKLEDVEGAVEDAVWQTKDKIEKEKKKLFKGVKK